MDFCQSLVCSWFHIVVLSWLAAYLLVYLRFSCRGAVGAGIEGLHGHAYMSYNAHPASSAASTHAFERTKTPGTDS